MSTSTAKIQKIKVSSRSLGMFIALGLLASQFCNASPNARTLAEYFDIPQRVTQETQQVSTQMAVSYPHIADVLRRSIKYMRRGEMLDRAEVIFDSGASQKDIQAFVSFSATPLGQRVGEVLRTKLNPQDIQTAFARYSSQEQAEINRFFASSAAINVMSSLSSPTWRQTWKLYGELLMCRFVEKEEPARFEGLRNQGKCLSEK